MNGSIHNALINIEQAKIEIDNALFLGLALGSLVTFWLISKLQEKTV